MKLPPGTGPIIHNYGSGSFSFYQRKEKYSLLRYYFYRKTCINQVKEGNFQGTTVPYLLKLSMIKKEIQRPPKCFVQELNPKS